MQRSKSHVQTITVVQCIVAVTTLRSTLVSTYCRLYNRYGGFKAVTEMSKDIQLIISYVQQNLLYLSNSHHHTTSEAQLLQYEQKFIQFLQSRSLAFTTGGATGNR